VALNPGAFQDEISGIRRAFAVKQGIWGDRPCEIGFIIAPAWLLLACCGCCIGPTVDTVPWWKGLPSMMIEPTSLEGMVWRDHLRAKHAERSMLAHRSVQAYNSPEDSGPLEQIPLPSEQPRPLLPIPIETTGAGYQVE
jgi:hypothetical protein